MFFAHEPTINKRPKYFTFNLVTILLLPNVTQLLDQLERDDGRASIIAGGARIPSLSRTMSQRSRFPRRRAGGVGARGAEQNETIFIF